MINEAILSLGSNIGKKIFYIDKAINCLNTVPDLRVEKVSNFYETKPWGVKNYQENYINCCVKILTSLNAYTLLGVCLGIETGLGRKRPYKFAPRTIDIDIIIFNNLKIEDENLILPHPRAKERAFVLIPMQEVCDEKIFRDLNFKKALKYCDISGIKRATI